MYRRRNLLKKAGLLTAGTAIVAAEPASADSLPSIDDLDVSVDAEDRIVFEYAVSDADGDLASVEAEVWNGNFVYVPDQSGDNIVIFDCSDPTSPSVQGTVSDTGSDDVRDIAKVGGTAYTACGPLGSEGIGVWDLTDPRSPSQVQFVSTGSIANIEAQGDVVAATDPGSDLIVIADATEPQNISLAVQETTGLIRSQRPGIFRRTVAFVDRQGTTDDLRVWDVSDFSSPTMVTTQPAGFDNPAAATMIGHYLYVVSESSGNLTALNLKDPANPFEIFTMNITNSPSPTEIIGSQIPREPPRAYVIDQNDNSLHIMG